MIELLKILLSLSLSGALLILVLLLCKPLVNNKLSKRWQYYIWLIVVVRLLFPFAPKTNLMGMVFQHIDNAVIQTNTSLQLEQVPPALLKTNFSDQSNVSDQVGAGNTGQMESSKITSPSIFETVKQNIAVICLLVWLIVAACLLIRKVTVYQSFVKYIMAGQIEISDIQLWERVGKLVEQTGIKGPVEIYTNGLISSPLLIGFFRPCIMLPTTELSESDFENTILHELTHFKRRDMFYKWLVQVTICLHWFNPIVYIMGREVNRTCELSCDEAVIKSLDEVGRRAYGDTLLNAVGIGGNYKNSLATVTLNENTELLKERLDVIMSYQEKSKFVVSITLLVTILFCTAATTVGAYAATSTNDNETPWSNMGGTGQPYTYSQTGYYQGSYIFELGWNLNDKGYNAYVDKAEFTLSDLTTITVSFDKSCKEDLQDKEMLADLKALVERLKEQHSNSTNPLERPLVVSVNYIGRNKLVKLAEEYYINGKLTRFSAIFSALDKDVQKEYCKKMIEDGKNAFLSSTAKNMEPDILDFCLEETYQKRKLTLFSSIVPYITDSQRQTWIARTSKDNKTTYLSVLTEEDDNFPFENDDFPFGEDDD